MVTSDLGACEWFVWDIRRSGLIDRGQLDQLVGEFLKRQPRAEPPQLAEYLVTQNILSPFQAERILSGKSQGLVLGPYILSDAIGQGSMGQVYKALNKTDNKWYAVKVLPRRSMWNVRLARRQVRTFAQFSHPAVVPFVDVGTAGGQHYLVWPLVEGETLEAKVERDGKLTPDMAATMLSQISQGLAAAHQNELFHGLLKPSNILLGSDGQAKILDFGIGSLLAENEGESLVDTMSTANTLTSGLDCASPESIMEPTNRTRAGDQYSLGCVLYYCLSGRYPFGDGTAVEKMMAHQFKPPTSIRDVAPGVPEGLGTVVDRLMQKAPEARYAGIDELVEALQPYAIVAPRGGSRFGSAVGSSHGSRFPAVPSVGRSQPATSSAHVPTPQGGSLTPLPSVPRPATMTNFQPPPEAPKPARQAVPTLKPAAVTRSSFGVGNTSQSQVPTAVEAVVPVAVPASSHSDAPFAEAAHGRNAQPEQERRRTSPLVMVMVAGIVIVGVYVLAKTFLFQS
ncbi:MAG TPA: protein kinase [Gemmataceae bacterium]|jgi:serine/threonine-protein kinase|nr:protein kinase [Gemmataceae bacterium]